MKFIIFEKLINQIKNQYETASSLISIGIDLYDYNEYWMEIISIMFASYYGEFGADLIFAYIYEYVDDSSKLYHKNVESLWKAVEKYRVSENFVEYKINDKNTITNDDIFELLNNNHEN